MRGVVASALLALITSTAAAPVFRLHSGGQLRGLARANSSAFLGIRFAQPPVGKLRWSPPVASPQLTAGIVNATALAPSCMQTTPPAKNTMSEDCLFLNVYTPQQQQQQLSQQQKLLPVLLFIHGGCFVGDGTANPVFNGTHMVELAAAGVSGSEAVVVVTVAYRLNAYGFLGGEELRARNHDDNSTGNWGVQDQRMAMRWVAQNIAAFGGDPARVTIFGHSAGAGSVSVHLVTPRSRGLFARAGIMSGSFTNWAAHSSAAAAANFRRLLEGVACKDLPCLLEAAEQRPADLAAFVAVGWTGVAPCRDGCAFAPQVDGVELPDWPLALAKQAAMGVPAGSNSAPAFGHVRILHGSTIDDGYAFVKADNFHNLTNDANAAACAAYREAAWGDAPGYDDGALTAQYPLSAFAPRPNGNHDTADFIRAERMETDFAYACPARWASAYSAQATAAAAAAEHGGGAADGTVFRYIFAQRTPDGADAEFVPHGKVSVCAYVSLIFVALLRRAASLR